MGGGHEQAVHHRQGLPGQFGVCGDLRPDVERGGIERQDAPRKALLHLAQPGGEFLAAALVGLAQLEDAFFDFSQGDDADEQAGFVLFVQQMMPVDLAKKTAELPQFTVQVRRARQNEAFNLWLQSEANRELGGILKQLAAQNAAAGAAKQP